MNSSKNVDQIAKAREIILDAFTIVEPGILLSEITETRTEFVHTQSFIVLQEYCIQHNIRYLITSFGDGVRSDATSRAISRKYFPELTKNLDYIILIIKNPAFRIALRFFLQGLPTNCEIKVVKNIADGIEMAQKIKTEKLAAIEN